MHSFSAQGIILWKKEYGEHDLLVSFLTKGYGKITAIAKNAKKSVKRFGGVLELFTMVEAVFKPSKNNGLSSLVEVSLDSPFDRIRTDHVRAAYAGYWSEIISGWLEEEHPQDDIFFLLRDILENLDAGVIPLETLDTVFLIKLLQLSGFSPDFSVCSECGKITDDLFDRRFIFDIKNGRITCQKCVSEWMKKTERKAYFTATDIYVSTGTINELRWIQNNDRQAGFRIRLKSSSVKESRAVFGRFLPFHLGKELKSLRLLDRIRHEKIEKII
jgi:DNA repair protein RecO (recombination protein O)